MKELLEIIFRSFWTFAGTVVLVVIVLEGIASIIQNLRK